VRILHIIAGSSVRSNPGITVYFHRPDWFERREK